MDLKHAINLKPLLIAAILLVLVIVILFAKGQVATQRGELGADTYRYISRESAYGDFNGDGESEIALVLFKDPFFANKSIDFNGFIAIYKANGEEIARMPEGLPIPYELLSSEFTNMATYQPDKNNKKEFLRLQIIAGSHHFDNLFLGISGNELLPVCKVSSEALGDYNDCAFYTTRDDLLVEDIDGDGLVEIVEFVDEYPPTGGRGRGVIWGIYSFNGDSFEPQLGEAYDRLFGLIIKDYSGYIKKSDAKNSGLETIRDFWKGKQPE